MSIPKGDTSPTPITAPEPHRRPLPSVDADRLRQLSEDTLRLYNGNVPPGHFLG